MMLMDNFLTLSRPRWREGGWEGGGPAATLNLNNVFNISANGQKLQDFFLSLSGDNLLPLVTVY